MNKLLKPVLCGLFLANASFAQEIERRISVIVKNPERDSSYTFHDGLCENAESIIQSVVARGIVVAGLAEVMAENDINVSVEWYQVETLTKHRNHEFVIRVEANGVRETLTFSRPTHRTTDGDCGKFIKSYLNKYAGLPRLIKHLEQHR